MIKNLLINYLNAVRTYLNRPLYLNVVRGLYIFHGVNVTSILIKTKFFLFTPFSLNHPIFASTFQPVND